VTPIAKRDQADESDGLVAQSSSQMIPSCAVAPPVVGRRELRGITPDGLLACYPWGART
jgi:hypothetical protein